MTYDVIVCGAGPSGLNAAISAKRNGANVLLIESSGLVGGNMTTSLVAPWMTFHKNGNQIIKGIAQELIDKMIDRGFSKGHIVDPLGFCETITPVDIEGVKQVLFDMVIDEGIDVLLHSFVYDVILEDNHIVGVKTISKSGTETYTSKTIIDATGDGDIAALANCEHILGRTKDGLTQPLTSIFQVGNVDIERLKIAVWENQSDFVLRANYDYEYLAISGFFEKVKTAKDNKDLNIPRDRVLLFEEVREGYVSVNMTRVQKKSAIDVHQLTEAELKVRKQIKEVFNFLKNYIPGFENSFISSTPSKIGVRETRHIIGQYLLTIEDIVSEKEHYDSIALSGFPMDIHSPDSNTLELDSKVINKPIQIPLRSLIPTSVKGLIISGRCISATHEVCAAIRVIPTVMAIGEAAGVLAAIASQKSVAPDEVSYIEVQKRLEKQNQIIR